MKKTYFEYIFEKGNQTPIDISVDKEQLDVSEFDFFKNLRLGLDRIKKVNERDPQQVISYNATKKKVRPTNAISNRNDIVLHDINAKAKVDNQRKKRFIKPMKNQPKKSQPKPKPKQQSVPYFTTTTSTMDKNIKNK